MSEAKSFDHQEDRRDTPWTLRQRLGLLAWHFAWPLLCGWTPKPANRWRLLILKLFGATIRGRPFVHQRARIQIPWHLVLHHGASVGDRANVYSLGPVTIGPNAVVAQEAYLCTGTHAFDRAAMNLIVAPIIVEEEAFIAARAFVLPGVRIGARAIVGACSVVTRDVAAASVVAGNPAGVLRVNVNANSSASTTLPIMPPD